MIMKILMAAQDIPLGSIVTKRTGDKLYTVREGIKIYGTPEQQSTREIKCDDGTRFLISETGDISIVSNDTELLWHVSDEDLYSYLDGKINGPHQ